LRDRNPAAIYAAAHSTYESANPRLT